MKKSALLTTVLLATSMAVWAQPQTQSGRKSTSEESGQYESKTKAKETSKTVVGRVTKFEEGQKLEITTNNKQHRTFDLNAKDTTVTGAENAKLGQMVRVIDRKENGKHTITIEPYTSASAKSKRGGYH